VPLHPDSVKKTETGHLSRPRWRIRDILMVDGLCGKMRKWVERYEGAQWTYYSVDVISPGAGTLVCRL
jgi:hypothetical protein